MAVVHEESGTPGIDESIAEMGGEEAVVAMINDTKLRVAEGSLRRFHDKESFLEFFRQGRRSQTG